MKKMLDFCIVYLTFCILSGRYFLCMGAKLVYSMKENKKILGQKRHFDLYFPMANLIFQIEKLSVSIRKQSKF